MTIRIDEDKIKKDYPNNKVVGKTFDERVVIENVEGFQMIDCKFTHDGDDDVLYLEDCRKVKIIDCEFPGKRKKGNFIDITGHKSNKIEIIDCEFKNHTHTPDENGGEAIMIGRGEYSGCKFRTLIKGCTFKNCGGDDELISIKTCENVLEDNRFEDWDHGAISIRNGGFNVIRNNKLIGKGGGIIVRGRGNKIIGNTHKNNNNTKDDFRPLVIEMGNEPEDKNFENRKPLEDPKKGPTNTKYARAIDNTIKDNTYENCKGPCVVWGQENRDEKPKDNIFTDNTLKADDVDSKFLELAQESGIDKEELMKDNTIKNNKMKGDKAKLGDLPEKAIE